MATDTPRKRAYEALALPEGRTGTKLPTRRRNAPDRGRMGGVYADTIGCDGDSRRLLALERPIAHE